MYHYLHIKQPLATILHLSIFEEFVQICDRKHHPFSLLLYGMVHIPTILNPEYLNEEFLDSELYKNFRSGRMKYNLGVTQKMIPVNKFIKAMSGHLEVSFKIHTSGKREFNNSANISMETVFPQDTSITIKMSNKSDNSVVIEADNSGFSKGKGEMTMKMGEMLEFKNTFDYEVIWDKDGKVTIVKGFPKLPKPPTNMGKRNYRFSKN